MVGLAVYDAWAEAVENSEVRMQVLEWMVGLQEDGPPADGVFDPFRETWSATVPGTTVTAEYIVAPFLDPPAIAIRHFN